MTDKKQEVYINKINELNKSLSKDFAKDLPKDLSKDFAKDFSKVLPEDLTKDLLFYYDLYYNNKLDNDETKKIIINIIELYKLLFTINKNLKYKESIDMLIFNQQLYLSLIDLDESDELKNEKYLDIKKKMNKLNQLNQFNKIKYLNLLCTYQKINI